MLFKRQRDSEVFLACLGGGWRMFPVPSVVWKVLTDVVKVVTKHPGRIPSEIAPSSVYKALRETNMPEHTAVYLFCCCGLPQLNFCVMWCRSKSYLSSFIKAHTLFSNWWPDTLPNTISFAQYFCPWFSHVSLKGRYINLCPFSLCKLPESLSSLSPEWPQTSVSFLSQGQASHGFMTEVDLAFINTSYTAFFQLAKASRRSWEQRRVR